ncbi:hypothetical protein QCN29_17725 [Streptomyces sp. HNM0663]|uniref:Uncharacterized protein n=1 Tax=Streptomyces chengmaiensis TaxID=3040919 RepID=A0ABT6HPE9_9ACTN|nr:hypothetical protein [Streptomyces chengmaiensis]MDH2390597.1 hypothetical protein [Streptomyces chengmaiensis]
MSGVWRSLPARLRAAHPVVVLRWLRTGVLVTVAMTALLYVVVSTQAGNQVAAAERTDAAIKDIFDAQVAAGKADDALKGVAETQAEDLIGTSVQFTNATARVSSLLTSATEGNAAGRLGLSHIQFVQGQLTTCVQRANRAVRDESGMDVARQELNREREKAGDNDNVTFTGGLMASLEDLEELQQQAVDEQRASHWLNPVLFWPLLIGPAVVMLVLVWASGRIIARHYRQYPSPALALAWLATAVVGIATGVLCSLDRAPDAAMAVMLPLLAAAGALAYLAYRPRLAEYRFPRS